MLFKRMHFPFTIFIWITLLSWHISYSASANETVIGDNVKVLCMILTTGENHATKAIHLKNTWGKRCDTLLFMSTVQDLSLPSIALPLKEGDDLEWNNLKDALRYVHKHHSAEADWVLKASDNTYVIMENLKYMLSRLDPSQSLYLGNQMEMLDPYAEPKRKQFKVHHVPMTVGSTYVLSKAALRRFVEVALFNPSICQDADDEEYTETKMRICMKALKVTLFNTRDSKGRERFMDIHPQYLLAPNLTSHYNWFFPASVYNIPPGMGCCSPNPVSFHQIKPQEMYVLELLLYYLRPFGVRYVSDFVSGDAMKTNSTKSL